MDGMLGKKLGMTQIFTADGDTVQVTVVEVGPCVVVTRRTAAKDGYDAVQLGLVEAKPPRHVTKPQQGHFKKAGATPTRKLAEFEITADEAWAAGDQVKCSMFQEKDFVDVVGTSKGKGFQGVMKRHGFKGGRATPRLDVPSRPGLDRRLVLPVARLSRHEGDGAHGRQADHDQEPPGGQGRRREESDLPARLGAGRRKWLRRAQAREARLSGFQLIGTGSDWLKMATREVGKR